MSRGQMTLCYVRGVMGPGVLCLADCPWPWSVSNVCFKMHADEILDNGRGTLFRFVSESIAVAWSFGFEWIELLNFTTLRITHCGGQSNYRIMSQQTLWIFAFVAKNHYHYHYTLFLPIGKVPTIRSHKPCLTCCALIFMVLKHF